MFQIKSKNIQKAGEKIVFNRRLNKQIAVSSQKGMLLQ